MNTGIELLRSAGCCWLAIATGCCNSQISETTINGRYSATISKVDVCQCVASMFGQIVAATASGVDINM